MSLAAAGTRNERVAPAPSFCDAHSSPSCRSMIERLTDKPMPMPPALVHGARAKHDEAAQIFPWKRQQSDAAQHERGSHVARHGWPRRQNLDQRAGPQRPAIQHHDPEQHHRCRSGQRQAEGPEACGEQHWHDRESFREVSPRRCSPLNPRCLCLLATGPRVSRLDAFGSAASILGPMRVAPDFGRPPAQAFLFARLESHALRHRLNRGHGVLAADVLRRELVRGSRPVH